MNNPTRGSGLLEGFLAQKRAGKANELIKKYKKTGKILDIGCGSYPYFLTHIKFNQKYGIDPSLNSSPIKGINLTKMDVTKEKLPFKTGFFEVVTMLAVFEHLDHDKLDFVLREAIRVLKKDGLLIITTPAPWSDKILHFMAISGLISKEEIHEHKHHYSRKYIEKMLKDAGFKKNNVKSGYFEAIANMWFSGVK